ncbi:DNA replication/repair protein RecF [Propionibacterium freudenreichii]|uniref:DNA replication/repair protein RecF n=1 Tax=Propionibacterium freudenreichii TaxID=1744 RepID=UPI0005433C1A|nr:DNA replication/repair protein RecF [Propionibacterium freudenreichii]AJQ89746.1 DNA replication and repair protein RecF [Propionibacterium freudenreichii subsp. freudenreichii]MDK9343223.1 DNA replication/repair protein RecF [Propionibacterium freudenreichii]CEG91203.1 DNA replication and repair protein recF [Propionibacterium freudenreichii]
MFVEHLELKDFRSYEAAKLDIGPGVSVFVGPNGHGKTNLVEAVEYLSTLSSHRVSADAPLIRAGTSQAIVRALVVAGRDDPRKLLLELEINAGRANHARINRAPVRRMRDFIGALRTVVFSPEDLAMVKGDPTDRRAFLDALVITRWPRLAGVKSDYDRVLRQRNTLLKTLARRSSRVDGGDVATLDVWNERLAQFGAELLAARLATLSDLMPYARASYAAIAPVNNRVDARYKSSLGGLSELLGYATDGAPGELPEAADTDDEVRTPAPGPDQLAVLMMDAMAARRGDELARGVTLVGPHRDDVTLTIGTLPAKGYASHGESWSLALALRLGSLDMLRADDVEPVLVLDDVFAELDVTRRDRLADAVAKAEQVLVTAAVGSDVPGQLNGQRFDVDLRGSAHAGHEESATGPRVSIVSPALSTGSVHRSVDND